jgi:hypothetical protein
MRYQTAWAALGACALAIVVASMPQRALAVDCSGSQPRPIELGVSGGNIHSFNKKKTLCSSGTLGSMVQDGSGTQFILSNNHVLDDINKGKRGDPIVQPGLADVSCVQDPTTAVANLSRAVKINFGGTNTVDAAIAEVIPGDVSSSIMNIGPIASTTVAPSPGLAVQKQGTATCLTMATISGVGMHGKISYGKGKSARFVNQIVINGPLPPNNFGGPGDSGSLIVTTDSCPRAVGLLFAGSGDQKQTIANPISSVLSKLHVSMTGGCTPAVTAPQAVEQAGNATVSKELLDSATAVRDRHEDQLMKIPGAVGTAIGMSDTPGQPAIEVYIDKMTPEAQASAPKEVEGLPVKLIENGGFVAY